jgi:hypothetical protein
VASWLGWLDRSSRAFSLVALRTPKPLYDLCEGRVPSREGGEGVRIASPNVSARAAQIDQVLAELADCTSIQYMIDLNLSKSSAELNAWVMKRESIDDLIDAVVWMRRLRNAAFTTVVSNGGR